MRHPLSRTFVGLEASGLSTDYIFTDMNGVDWRVRQSPTNTGWMATTDGYGGKELSGPNEDSVLTAINWFNTSGSPTPTVPSVPSVPVMASPVMTSTAAAMSPFNPMLYTAAPAASSPIFPADTGDTAPAPSGDLSTGPAPAATGLGDPATAAKAKEAAGSAIVLLGIGAAIMGAIVFASTTGK